MNNTAVVIKAGKEQMDIPLIHRFLDQDSYWAKGISYELVENSLSGSFCMGAFIDDRQVGFGRLITDYHTFGWLADVFVLPEYRGKGISRQLLAFLLEQPWAKRLRRIMLNTLDAHGLYRQYQFESLHNPQLLMEIYRPDVHLQQELV
ncbi:GNAT family N-acetyltransferase [Chitinophaga sp. Mgbs1]|uniref:GNAT family N-acetyltransferase n=1 Tax=Chitinophaga solisilvae TaxID=1233460 RepID=A0A433WH07_9BACT|nr:GNAT family N-acetyltransferase [Chitinophaga solisilvae]